VDGKSAALFAGNSFTLATPVSAGKHTVRFVYRTPGRSLGIAFSLSAIGLLALLIWRDGRNGTKSAGQNANAPTMR
jgi:hypothetical protein